MYTMNHSNCKYNRTELSQFQCQTDKYTVNIVQKEPKWILQCISVAVILKKKRSRSISVHQLNNNLSNCFLYKELYSFGTLSLFNMREYSLHQP